AKPFFAAALSPFGFARASPTPATLAKLGLAEMTDAGAGADPAATVYAGTYERAGKRILFVRLADYRPTKIDATTNYLRALFDDFQPLTDALVFDETHNPGGL